MVSCDFRMPSDIREAYVYSHSVVLYNEQHSEQYEAFLMESIRTIVARQIGI